MNLAIKKALMLSSKEDHQIFIELIQESSLFSTLVNKIGSRLFNSEGKKSGLVNVISKINNSRPKIIREQDSSQEIFNESSSNEDIIVV